jgi:hypothetical protein
LISACSKFSMVFFCMSLPVRLFSEPLLISRLKSRNASEISFALHSFSSSLVWRSMAILSYSLFWLLSFSSMSTMEVRVSLYLRQRELVGHRASEASEQKSKRQRRLSGRILLCEQSGQVRAERAGASGAGRATSFF